MLSHEVLIRNHLLEECLICNIFQFELLVLYYDEGCTFDLTLSSICRNIEADCGQDVVTALQNNAASDGSSSRCIPKRTMARMRKRLVK